MRIISDPGALFEGGEKSRRVAIAIGVFDGVHLGHQQVLRQALADARQQGGYAVAVTFDRHPSSIVAPERAPLLIYSQEQKLEKIGAMGMDATWVVEFTAEFGRINGESFVRGLKREFPGLCSVCVGHNFTFGHQRSGNVELLRRLGGETGFNTHGLASVSLDGEVVSSTRIREQIREGDLDGASQMLGRPYSIKARVITGDKLGRQIGFPTANLDVRGLVTPPHGVYAAHVLHGGKSWNAAINIGVRPTIAGRGGELRLEAHLLDANLDLYGELLEVLFVAQLREERKFSNVELLKAQIASDVAAARRLLR
ncbi:MAG: bifunctional riboflavin kinase/FAD synthetase [Verrucomicrobiota bacterium]|nr:bifunctional riboflavin kinase/FAD synthetase [Verrucomicrobiota bacterium]